MALSRPTSADHGALYDGYTAHRGADDCGRYCSYPDRALLLGRKGGLGSGPGSSARWSDVDVDVAAQVDVAVLREHDLGDHRVVLTGQPLSMSRSACSVLTR